MYTRNLIAHRGTDNQILIEFVNQDQKPVDITGKTFTYRLISFNGNLLLLEKPLESVNETKGQAKIVLTEQELEDIVPGLASFSIEQTSTGNPYEPVYVDDNAGGRGNIQIVDSIMPSFSNSLELSIPDHGASTTYTTSTLNTDSVDLYTFQVEMSSFTGSIVVEGASDTDNLWYTIQTETISSSSNLYTFNVLGYHAYLRFNITETAGTVDKILYR